MALGRARHVHYNKVLTNIAVEFRPPDLAAREVLPVHYVSNSTDLYPVFDKTLFDQYDDIRADGDESNEVSRGWRYVPYVCETHALKDHITKKQRQNWDSEVDLEADTAEWLKQLIWNRYEVKVFGDGGILRKPSNNIYSSNLNWTNLATANVKGDLVTATEAIEVACGLSPNIIVLTPQVGRHIAQTAQWLEYHKYTQTIANSDLPAEIYGFRAVYVKSLINTARKGQPPSLSRIMGDDVWLGYVDPGGPRYKSVTYGCTIMTYEEVAKWYVDERKADAVEYEAEYTPHLIAKECGGLLQSVLTA
jgi:hypothetical protein